MLWHVRWMGRVSADRSSALMALATCKVHELPVVDRGGFQVLQTDAQMINML